MSHIINKDVEEGRWKGIRVSQGSPSISHLFFADDMVLFSEASLEQIEVIKNCLDLFCNISGQKVNYEKSSIFFSTGVDENTAVAITKKSCIPRTENLGRYLGVPSMHGRMKNRLFSPIIERVDSALEGWKSKQLSFSGRVVLAQSAISAIPLFAMQTILLPKGVTDTIERSICKFIWGSSSGSNKRGIHLVSWEKLTEPKNNGGLGLRSMANMNLALLAKLGWRLITEHNSLWAKVMGAKYMHARHEVSNFIAKQEASTTWKGLTKAACIIEKGAT